MPFGVLRKARALHGPGPFATSGKRAGIWKGRQTPGSLKASTPFSYPSLCPVRAAVVRLLKGSRLCVFSNGLAVRGRGSTRCCVCTTWSNCCEITSTTCNQVGKWTASASVEAVFFCGYSPPIFAFLNRSKDSLSMSTIDMPCAAAYTKLR